MRLPAHNAQRAHLGSHGSDFLGNLRQLNGCGELTGLLLARRLRRKCSDRGRDGALLVVHVRALEDGVGHGEGSACVQLLHLLQLNLAHLLEVTATHTTAASASASVAATFGACAP